MKCGTCMMDNSGLLFYLRIYINIIDLCTSHEGI